MTNETSCRCINFSAVFGCQRLQFRISQSMNSMYLPLGFSNVYFPPRDLSSVGGGCSLDRASHQVRVRVDG